MLVLNQLLSFTSAGMLAGAAVSIPFICVLTAINRTLQVANQSW